MVKQITQPIKGKMYSFEIRLTWRSAARAIANRLNSEKHAYYTKVQEKGNIYFDVRTEN